MSEQYEVELTAFDGESGEVRVTFDIPRSEIDDGPVIRTGARWILRPEVDERVVPPMTNEGF